MPEPGPPSAPGARARSILDTVRYVTVATVDPEGSPWNSPVAGFRFPGDYASFYWASWRENQHSRNIRATGRAFVVVFDSTPDGPPTPGVYMPGTATELNDPDEVAAAARVFAGDPYNPADAARYLGTSPRRIYRFTPERFWTNDDSTVDGEFVDVRTDATA